MKYSQSESHLFLKIANSIYELARIYDNPNKIKALVGLANQLASTLDAYENTLHPDLGQNLVEYVMLRLDAANSAVDLASVAHYEKVLNNMLAGANSTSH